MLLYFLGGLVILISEFIGRKDNSYFFSFISDANGWIVFVPIGGNRYVIAYHSSVFDYQEGVGVAVDSDAEVVSLLEFLGGRYGVDLNGLFWTLRLLRKRSPL